MDVYNNKRFESQFPSFGSWENYHGIPFTNYFESARHRVFRHFSYSDDDDLYRCTFSATIPFQTSRKIADQEKGSTEIWVGTDDLDSFPRMTAARMLRPNPKPVDEDLYKIPVQLVHAKAKRKKRRVRVLHQVLASCNMRLTTR